MVKPKRLLQLWGSQKVGRTTKYCFDLTVEEELDELPRSSKYRTPRILQY
jgi:hypothetical protein